MNGQPHDALAPIGHNRPNARIRVEVRFFNSLTRFAGLEGSFRTVELAAGSTVADLAVLLRIPLNKVFLVLINGRDITRGLVGEPVEGAHMIDEGDVVAFSGAVPYSYGYGSPVV